MHKPNRTIIEDISPSAAAGDGRLSDSDLDAVTGGASALSVNIVPFTTVFSAAHGTKETTNTNNNGCHDTDSQWDYSTL